MSSSSSKKPRPKFTNQNQEQDRRLGDVETVEAVEIVGSGRRTVVSLSKSNARRNTRKVDREGDGSDRSNNNSSRAMFSGNITIHGGQITQAENVRDENDLAKAKANAFKLLQKRVATAAFHNSAQRVDPPRCHPDTRVEIIQSIYEWIIQSKHRKEWLLWLNGAAGAGKSAIMQSIAERCAQAAKVIGSFFFFRSDPTRNTIAPLGATLAYQLIQSIPETTDDILLTILSNPLIFDQSLETQLELLLVQPLLRLPPHLRRLFVVFIDGLDECNDLDQQVNLIKLFGNISRSGHPIIFLIASRREPQIEAAFLHRHVSDLLRTLALDNSDVEQTSDDIRRFLTDKFEDIIDTHLRRHLLPANWPPLPIVEEIITKSSGQFIYASVVINYVSSPRANPAHQLDIVRGIRLRAPSSQNPFTHLDALYQHIFSRVESLDKVLDILAFVLISKQNVIYKIEASFLLEAGDLEVYLADLTAVIECLPGTVSSPPELKFLHASLPDFLLDKSRSESYHIDIDRYRTKLLCMFLERVPPTLDSLSPTHNSNVVSDQEVWRLYTIVVLLTSGAKASDRLQYSFVIFNFKFHNFDMVSRNRWYCIQILTYLKQLNFNDHSQAYRHVLQLFATGLAKYWPSLSDTDKNSVRMESPDLADCISQIRSKRNCWFPFSKR